MIESSISMEYLLKLRLVVARFGEMDRAKWWNTQGQLGPLGALALQRGLPRTHYFAQARSVFTVAAHRCSEITKLQNVVNLWQLPAVIEEEFDSCWDSWLNCETWHDFFARLQTLPGDDLLENLHSFKLALEVDESKLKGWRKAIMGNAVLYPDLFSGSQYDLDCLAAGFAMGSIGSPLVPYMRLS